MIDQKKTKNELLVELGELRNQIATFKHKNATRKNKSQDALIRSEKFNFALLEDLDLGIEEIDVFGTILYGNKVYHKQYGYENEELIGKSIFEMIPTGKEKEELRNYLSFLVNDRPPLTPYFGEKITKNGQIINVEIAWNYKFDDAGKLTGFISIIKDITVLKKAKKELFESQKLSNVLLNAASESSFLIATNGIILALNTTAAKRLGRTVSELIGRNIYDYLPSKLAENRRQSGLKVIKSGKPVSHEDKRAEMYFSNTIYPVFDIDGNVTSLAIYARNITKEKQAELTLKKSHDELEKLVSARTKSLEEAVKVVQKEINERKQVEELTNKLSRIVQQTADHVLITDRNGVVEYVNPAFEDLTGYCKKEMIGRNPKILKSGIHNEKFYQKMWDQILSGKVYRGILINKKKNGSLFYEEKTITPIRDVKGTITHFVSTGKDVTEHMEAEEALKMSEEKLRVIYESSGDAILIQDENGYFECNKAALKMFRLKSKKELFGIGSGDLSLEILPNGKSASQVMLENQKTALEKGSVKYEWKSKRMDGTIFDSEIILSPVKLEGKSIFQAVIRDITDRKQADKKLQMSKEQLRALVSRIENIREGERTYIAREIHDELGHSLTVLLIDLHSLNNKTEFKNKKIAGEIKTMISLVNNLIETIRKIASDLRPGILDKLGLGPAIEWQFEEFKKRTKIDCIASIEDDFQEEITKEKSTVIFRIFQEVITNIYRHANASQVKVVLKTENKKIKLVVNDNGRGIKKGEIDNIHSLGLLGMKERATMVGGHFSISEAKKGGTEIKVSIPVNT